MEREKTISVAGVTATVVRKRVKNLRVTVLPPDGAVRVTAPSRCPEALIKAFLTEKADWITKHADAMKSKHANEPRAYASGEPVPLFGTVYSLAVLEHQPKTGVMLTGDRLVLSVKGEADANKREAILNEWYRERLKTEIEYLLLLWSE